MHIYIDESGIFNNPASKPSAVSVIAGLTLPSSQRAEIFKKFKRLTRNFPQSTGEVKGKELDEDQIRAVVTMLRRFDVGLELKVIDLALHPESRLAEFKQNHLPIFDSRISPNAAPTLRQQINEIKDNLTAMSYPLYVQFLLLVTLVHGLVTKMCHFYARRIPKELGTFHWIVDAKDQKLTDFEKTWSLAAYPIMAAMSLRDPFTRITGGDYSALERFTKWADAEMNAYIKAQPEFDASDRRNKEVGGLSLKEILGHDFKFENSKNNKGLQLVDILANAVQRAMNGRLQPKGWLDIGHLIVDQRPSAVEVVFLTTPSTVTPKKVTGPIAQIVQALNDNAQPMWTKADSVPFRIPRPGKSVDNSKTSNKTPH